MPQVQQREFASEEAANRPWKQDPYAFPLMHWVLSALTPATVETHWPLLLPPILATIDDFETQYKVRGCELLRLLLRATQSSVLKRTGLTGVFEEAVFPFLSYLPTLTPPKESIQLLNAAYPCLVQLVRTRYPLTTRSQDPEAWDAKVKMTTKYIRHGVLHGMLLAGQFPLLATCMVTHLETLINEEGIDSVRHLKEVVPLLYDILGDPFALAHPPLLLSATKTLQTVVLNAWPRMEGWKGNLLGSLCRIWIRIIEEGRDQENLLQLQESLQDTVLILDAALKKAEGDGLEADAATLIAADDTVADLFRKLKEDR